MKNLLLRVNENSHLNQTNYARRRKTRSTNADHRSDEGLMLVMSVLKLLTVANVGYQLSYQYKITLEFA